MISVLFITNVPSPYRVDFFNELGKLCDLTVVFDKNTSDERDESWCNSRFINFKGLVLKGISINTDTAICPGIIKVLKHNTYDCIINANCYSPTGMMAVAYCKFKHIEFFNEADGGFPKSGKGLKETLKRKITSAATGCFSTSDSLDTYYEFYGVDRSSIYRYPFSSLWKNELLPITTTTLQRSDLRNKYREINNIPDRKIILAVGQFIYRKGFDVLIKSMSLLPNDYYLFIIGGKKETYFELITELGLENVECIDFLHKEKLREYYFAADLFVLPTREDIWGLVVNEAMACGLPIITTTKCIAGLELVENGANGYLVDPDKPQELATLIKDILSDEVTKNRMEIESIRRIQGYTIEEMAKRHMEIISNLAIKE